MKKKIPTQLPILKTLFLIPLFFLSWQASALFNNATFASSTIVVSGYSMTVSGQVEALISRYSDFDIILSPGSSFTVISPDKKDFTINTTNGTSTYTKVCGYSNSSIVFISPATRSTSTISINGNCPGVLSVPSQVIGLSAVAGDSNVALSWTIPYNGGSAIIDYIVEYKPSSGSIYSIFNDGVSTNNSSTVSSLSNGISHDFRVIAVNTLGRGATSTSVTATPVATVVTPPSSGGGESYIPPTPVIPVTPTTPPATPVPTPYIAPIAPVVSNPVLINSNIKRGSSGKNVNNLQLFLISKKYLPANNNTGAFDNNTVIALKKYQCAKGLICKGSEAVGYGAVGPKTLTALNADIKVIASITTPIVTTPIVKTPITPPLPLLTAKSFPRTLYKGLKGTDVTLLQKYLNKYGSVPITDTTGYYGATTVTALYRFQVANGIQAAPASQGVFGKATQTIFIKVMNKKR